MAVILCVNEIVCSPHPGSGYRGREEIPLVHRHSPALNVRAFIPEGRLYKATTIVKGAEGSSGHERQIDRLATWAAFPLSPPKATVGHQDANLSLSARSRLMHRSKQHPIRSLYRP